LKQIEGWSLVHAIKVLTDDAWPRKSNNNATPDGSVTFLGKGSPLTKKQVSWADDTPLDMIGVKKQQSINRVDEGRSMQPAEEVGSISVQLNKQILEKVSPRSLVRRPITRSVSPLKQTCSPTLHSSPVIRSKSSLNPLLLSKQAVSPNLTIPEPCGGNSTKDATSPTRHGKPEARTSRLGMKGIDVMEDTTSKKLDFDSVVYDPRAWIPVEEGSFDLGFDDPPEEQKEIKHALPGGLPEITSSNEDEFYGPAEDYELLAKQMGEDFFPTNTCVPSTSTVVAQAPNQEEKVSVFSESTPANNVDQKIIEPCARSPEPASKTPIPQAH
jgi:hypothetical protein